PSMNPVAEAAGDRERKVDQQEADHDRAERADATQRQELEDAVDHEREGEGHPGEAKRLPEQPPALVLRLDQVADERRRPRSGIRQPDADAEDDGERGLQDEADLAPPREVADDVLPKNRVVHRPTAYRCAANDALSFSMA